LGQARPLFGGHSLVCAAVAALAGCATGEPPPAPERATPAEYRNAAEPAATPQAASSLPRPSSAWWREFAHADLDRLEEAALANNRDYRIAIARVSQAKAQARLADASRTPTVDLFAKPELIQLERGRNGAEDSFNQPSLSWFRAGVRVGYEVDVWGKLGYAADSATALAAASEHHREAVALTLTSDVANAYFEYLSFAARAASAERGVESRRRSLAAVDKRVAAGDATALESAQQRAALATAEVAHAAHAQRRERAFNRLALLTGVAPADLKLVPQPLASIAPPPVNPGLPSELLCRRPDVRRAEAQLLGADFDVRSLRANLLPSFSMSGEIGMGALHLTRLTGPGALYYLISAIASQTLFDGGRKAAQLDLSRARHLEMIEQYAGTLLAALREVEDALAVRRLTGDQHEARAQAHAVASGVYRMNERVFRAGGSDLLTLYDAEQRMVTAEDAAEEALHDRMRAMIDLYKALGGGSRGEVGDPCVRVKDGAP
jgi:NodT family efflux transporter outer membrane factor (OMF) lipoprotein